jgi:hypothetical protein
VVREALLKPVTLSAALAVVPARTRTTQAEALVAATLVVELQTTAMASQAVVAVLSLLKE